MNKKIAVSISLDGETLEKIDKLKIVFGCNRSVVVRGAITLLSQAVEQAMAEGDD